MSFDRSTLRPATVRRADDKLRELSVALAEDVGQPTILLAARDDVSVSQAAAMIRARSPELADRVLFAACCTVGPAHSRRL